MKEIGPLQSRIVAITNKWVPIYFKNKGNEGKSLCLVCVPYFRCHGGVEDLGLLVYAC